MPRWHTFRIWHKLKKPFGIGLCFLSIGFKRFFIHFWMYFADVSTFADRGKQSTKEAE